eukprot:5788029-Amphidinium_carterae.2
MHLCHDLCPATAGLVHKSANDSTVALEAFICLLARFELLPCSYGHIDMELARPPLTLYTKHGRASSNGLSCHCMRDHQKSLAGSLLGQAAKQDLPHTVRL